MSLRARNLQTRFESRRRQLLPRFYQGTPDHCLVVGRFCEWHPTFDEDRVPEEPKEIRRVRAEFLLQLALISAQIPGDDWIVGQRVRYLLEARDDTTALRVARECAGTRWWCDALRGMALHARGDFFGADSSYATALERMPSARRCHWMNVSPLLDGDYAKTIRRMPCGAREAAVARVWFMADPLLMIPGNERRTEHFSRVVHTYMQEDATNTYGLRWAGDLGEMIVRFGWVEKWTQEPSASMYPGVAPSVTGHERRPGFHFFMLQRPPDDLGLVADSLWDIRQFPPREQYAPRYARSFSPLDAQVARFRRGDSTMIVAAYDVGEDTLFRRRRFTAALIATSEEAKIPAVRAIVDAPTRQVVTLMSPWKSQLVGVELLARDSAGAARWRAGFNEIPLDDNRISLSDILFVDGAMLPGTLEEAIPITHAGTVFRRDRKVGLFWELYGRAPADSALPISLTITPIEGGLLGKAARALRIGQKPTPLNIRWQENGSAGVLSARAVSLDLSLVPKGRYAVKLEIGSAEVAKAAKVIEVR